MKTILALVLAASAIGTATAQTSVSIGINQPGVYGRINIGDVPPPALYRPEPVIIARPRVVVQQQPVYLYVPPAHQQNWRRYCGQYRACGQPVYFVRDEWVRERYEHEHRAGIAAAIAAGTSTTVSTTVSAAATDTAVTAGAPPQ